MGVIATLLPQPLHMQRLRRAIRDRHQLTECDDWPALARACEREPVRTAVVDLYADGSFAVERARRIKQRLPRLTVLAYVTMAPDRAHDLFEAGRAGVDGLVLAGQDDAPRSLLARIERAESRSLAGVVRRSLEGHDDLATEALLLAVGRANERLSASDLAQLLALPRRSITQRLKANGFPAPHRLLTWGRLIVAAHMLEDQRRSADRVAVSLEFPSGSAFRNTCQRYLHATPREIRARGGGAYVVRSLLRQVHDRAASAIEPRRRSPARAPALAI